MLSWLKKNMGELSQWLFIFLRSAGEKMVEKEIDKKGQGFEDEAIKEACVQMVRDSSFSESRLREVEDKLRKRGGGFFKNYCRVIMEMKEKTKPPTIKIVEGKKTIEKPDPEWVHPVYSFLTKLSTASTEKELDNLLASVGVFQKAPDGGWRNVFVLKDFLEPKVKPLANAAKKSAVGAGKAAASAGREVGTSVGWAAAIITGFLVLLFAVISISLIFFL